jgi:hypothetical protein
MLCALVLELSHTGELAEHGKAVEHPSKLGVGGDVGLNVECVLFGVKTAGNVEGEGLVGTATEVGGNLTDGDCVLVYDAVKGLIFLGIE